MMQAGSADELPRGEAMAWIKQQSGQASNRREGTLTTQQRL